MHAFGYPVKYSLPLSESTIYHLIKTMNIKITNIKTMNIYCFFVKTSPSAKRLMKITSDYRFNFMQLIIIIIIIIIITIIIIIIIITLFKCLMYLALLC